MKNYIYLDKITTPSDLKKLKVQELPILCDEIRHFLIHSLAISGGHFASNLGTVELTVALHYVYDSPADKLIWDVGHQAYVHKILTGRKDRLNSIRSYKGLHPFPFREESEHDILTVGHSSTSISAAVGIALANAVVGKKENIIPIIGDGALTAGMVFEALNHAGASKLPITIVFNDNNMSISTNQGALNKHSDKLFNNPIYKALRSTSKSLLEEGNPLRNLLKNTEQTLKSLVSPQISGIFTSLGIEYYGPYDGHNVIELVKLFQSLVNSKTPKILHIITQKGNGFIPAQINPIKYHAVSPFTVDDNDIAGRCITKKTASYEFSNLEKTSDVDGKPDKKKSESSSSENNHLTVRHDYNSNRIYVDDNINQDDKFDKNLVLNQVLNSSSTDDYLCSSNKSILEFKVNSNQVQLYKNLSQTYSQVYGEWLMSKANDSRFIAITPAMIEGSGMSEFANKHPEKVIDVAIAEQHAVTLAAGLAIGGIKPCVAIYSTFMQRAYDQIIHDLAIDNHNVIFAVDRAGIVGEDGQTHNGAFDISYLRCIPNLVITTPSFKERMLAMLDYCYDYVDGTSFVRYPRGKAKTYEFFVSLIKDKAQSFKRAIAEIYSNEETKLRSLDVLIDKWLTNLGNFAELVVKLDFSQLRTVDNVDLIKQNLLCNFKKSFTKACLENSSSQDEVSFNSDFLAKDFPSLNRLLNKKIAFLNFGDMLANILPLAMELGQDVYDFAIVKPFYQNVIEQLAEYDILVTLEQNTIVGGCYSLLLEQLNASNKFVKVVPIAIPDQFIEPMKSYQVNEELSINANGILQKLLSEI